MYSLVILFTDFGWGHIGTIQSCHKLMSALPGYKESVSGYFKFDYEKNVCYDVLKICHIPEMTA
jgi:hypothetical protein